VCQVSIRDRNGKRHRITRSAATQNEARKLLTKLKGKQDAHVCGHSPSVTHLYFPRMTQQF